MIHVRSYKVKPFLFDEALIFAPWTTLCQRKWPGCLCPSSRNSVQIHPTQRTKYTVQGTWTHAVQFYYCSVHNTQYKPSYIHTTSSQYNSASCVCFVVSFQHISQCLSTVTPCTTIWSKYFLYTQPVTTQNTSQFNVTMTSSQSREWRHRCVCVCMYKPVSYTHLTLPTNREV